MFLCAYPAKPLRAQTVEGGALIEAGAAAVTVDGYARSGLTDVASSVWGSAGRVAGSGSATAARFESGSVTGFGELHGAVSLAGSGARQTAIRVDGGAGSFGGRVTSRFAHGSLVLGGGNESGSFSEWLAAGGGIASNGIGTRGTADAGFGIAARIPFALLTTTFALASSGSVTYADGTIHAEWTPLDLVPATDARLAAAVDAGTRSSQASQLSGRSSWLSGTITLKVVPYLYLVSRAGYDPADPIRGTPGAASMAISLRAMAVHHATPASLGLLRTPKGTVVSAPLSGGRRLITVVLPDAASVEIMADFTAWRPVAMSRSSDGRWELAAAVEPGSHRMNVRADGGPWQVPPDLPAQDDDFGGQVGVLLVP